MSTKIEYADETWNPLAGCSPCSPGCDNCYASRAACGRFLKEHPLYKGLAVNNKWTGEVRLCTSIRRPDILDKPLHWKKPRTIFVCNMGDLFHEKVPVGWTCHVLDVVEQCPQHKFLFLTKRPELMRKHLYGLWDNGHGSTWQYMSEGTIIPNLYLGVTVCNQAEADAKIPVLLKIPAAHRCLSIEPVLEPIRLFRTNPCEHSGCFAHRTHPCEGCGYIGGWPAVDWVVVGCESGPNRRPCELDWIVEIVEQCQAAGIKVLVKQVSINGRVSHKMSEWPEKLRVREKI